MGRDWFGWHEPYGDPSSARTRRLAAIQWEIERELQARDGAGVKLISVCAGQGHDVLGLLETGRYRFEARLVELDVRNVRAARQRAEAGGLSGVEIVRGDAGSTSSYEGFAPADIVLVCGVFGNIPEADIWSTIDTLPQLLTAWGKVVWTRSRREPDPTPAIRRAFASRGFVEDAFVAPDGDVWSVGANRFVGRPRELQPGTRMFTFAT